MIAPINVQRLTTLLSADVEWGPVVHLPQVGSTNTEAASRGQVWSPVLTEHQTAGRGRLGRAWQDTPAASLAMSVLVPTVPTLGWLPLAAGLAVRSALSGEGVDALLKWPNDVLLPGDEGRKVCGILCQSGPKGVVVGIGINVAHERGELPVETATSLRLVGADVDRTDLAAAVLNHLAGSHRAMATSGTALEEVRAAYAQACDTVGRRVVVHHPDGTREEVDATGIDVDGHLCITGDAGSATVAAGDVQHIRLPGAPSH